jgi:hypothetical protein
MTKILRLCGCCVTLARSLSRLPAICAFFHIFVIAPQGGKSFCILPQQAKGGLRPSA